MQYSLKPGVLGKLSILAVASVIGLQNANAVVVATQATGENYSEDPDNGSQWDNVLRANSDGAGSAVYLRGGWILTAEHVADAGGTAANPPPTVLYEGVTYMGDSDQTYVLDNPTGSGLSAKADLALFRLDNDSSVNANLNPITSLPTVDLGAIPDTVLGTSNSTPITMIGFGGNTKRWGFNDAENVRTGYTAAGGNNDFVGFSSDYDRGTTGEGQAVVGDSGGAAFYSDGSKSVLGGIMLAVGTDGAGKDVTFYADIGTYADQINSIIPEPATGLLTLLSLAGLGFRRRRA